MSKTKQPSDRRGSRTKRNPRDPGPERVQSSKQSDSDEIERESDGIVDDEMELDTSKYERPMPKG